MDAMQEDASHIANVNEIPLEMRLEQHDGAVVHRAIDEIVHEEVDAHPRRHSEYRRQPEADHVAALERGGFRLHLGAAVKSDRPQGRTLVAEFILLTDSITAVGDGQQNSLLSRR